MMPKIPTVFVSRALSENSPIRAVVKDRGTIVDQSLIDITPCTEDIDIDQYTWLFFYSRNGVRCFYELYTIENVKGKKIAALGTGTAEELRHLGYTPDYIGNGMAEDIAEEYPKLLNSDTDSILFLRATNSLDTLYKLLKKKIRCSSTPIYRNTPIYQEYKKTHDVLVFTSSLNVLAYIEKNRIDSQVCIAIGHPTYKTLSEKGIKNIVLAQSPSELGIAATLDDIL